MESNRQKARRLWEEAEGKRTIKSIAKELGVAHGTVSRWKWADQWDFIPESPLHAVVKQQQRKFASRDRQIIEHIQQNETLSDRQRDFCAAYVVAPSAVQAALKTGKYKTYNTAARAAREMMSIPAVKNEIERLKQIKRMTLLVDGNDVLDMHIRIAFADITTFVEFGPEERPVIENMRIVFKEDGKPQMETTNIVRLKPSTQIDGGVISEVKEQEKGITIKLVDKQRSLDFLERYFELNPMDRHKKLYEEKRLKMEEEKMKTSNEEALEKLDQILISLNSVMS